MTELSDQLAIDRYDELLASHERLKVALDNIAGETEGVCHGDDNLQNFIRGIGQRAREALKLIPKGE